MQASYLLPGEPDWRGMPAYALGLLCFLGGLVFACVLLVKVFRGGKETIMSISPDTTEECADERR